MLQAPHPLSPQAMPHYSYCQAQGIHLLPIRHHSPNCARHVAAEIQRLQATAVLIEGADELNGLIPQLQNHQCKPPVAAYIAAEAPEQSASFYPFCDYSPEWQALQSAKAINAQVEFIDLPKAAKHSAKSACGDNLNQEHSQSELSDAWLQHSQFLEELAKRSGCRDQDELWDKLFELAPAYAYTSSSESFFAAVNQYCYLTRQNYSDGALAAEGNSQREQQMASRIASIRQTLSGPIVVVIGGFHMDGIAEQLYRWKTTTKPPKPQHSKQTAYLIRYSFDQLDSLRGYGAGMPTPGYYQRLWQLLQQHETADAYQRCAQNILVDIARLSRQRRLPSHLSTADASAALAQALGLAKLRGHSGPGRADCLDAIRSCYVKGDLNSGASVVMAVVEEQLRGHAIGDVPSNAGQPPIIDDFRRNAQSLGLNLDDTLSKTLNLDIYRKAKHRQTSQLMHRMAWLNTGFGQRLAGPNFVHGTQLERRHEQWQYAWSPSVEAQLIDHAPHGTTLLDACMHRLSEAIFDLDQQGEGRSMAAVTQLLTQALQLGLQPQLDRIMMLLEAHTSADPNICSLVNGMNNLQLLWQARDTLANNAVPELPALFALAYQRLCFLLPDLIPLASEDCDTELKALIQATELLQANQTAVDLEPFFNLLAALANSENNLLAGASQGLLYRHGNLAGDQALIDNCLARINGASLRHSERLAFLRGLIAACPELIWQQGELLGSLNQHIQTLEDDDFLTTLPILRQLFTDFTPQQLDRIGRQVAQLNGAEHIGNLAINSVSEAQMLKNQALEQQVFQSLQADQLDTWLAPKRPQQASTQ